MCSFVHGCMSSGWIYASLSLIAPNLCTEKYLICDTGFKRLSKLYYVHVYMVQLTSVVCANGRAIRKLYQLIEA